MNAPIHSVVVDRMTRRFAFMVGLVLLLGVEGLFCQGFGTMFPFSIGPDVALTEPLVPRERVPAGSKGRVAVRDGHLVNADGSRLRLYGTTLQYGACFPDSATAIAMADRFAALGLNAVRFMHIDYAQYGPISILADGATTDGLRPESMASLDWFVHVLEQRGIHPIFTFLGSWMPRPGDGVLQPDSIGFGGGRAIFFDPVVQNIHRRMIRQFLEHVNPHTGLAYKDDPALPYLVAAEDASFSAYWIYSGDVDADNGYPTRAVGRQRIALADAAWNRWLRTKAATTQALNALWTDRAQDTSNIVRNAGFEDPFSVVWTLYVAAVADVQALAQVEEVDPADGQYSMRIRVGSIGAVPQAGSIVYYQTLPAMRRFGYYRIRFKARTTTERGSRSLQVVGTTTSGASLGFAQELTLTSSWRQYDFTFMSLSTDDATNALYLAIGQDSGDVFLDGFDLREVDQPGLRPGESLEAGSVARTHYRDEAVTPQRSAHLVEFYRASVGGMFQSVYAMVRDTLKSDLLLCPTARAFSNLDDLLAERYEVTSTTDWRSVDTSMLRELYGGFLAVPGQMRMQDKAFVLNLVAASYPRPYVADLSVLWPAFAGVQDWDGMMAGIYASTARVATERIDSLSYWELESKPHVLAHVPFASTVVRDGLIATTERSIVVHPSTESLVVPRFYQHMPFSLGRYADPRMFAFRRVLTGERRELETYDPHTEIAAFRDGVDVRTLDAENGQVFWDATIGRMVVEAPKAIAVTGNVGADLAVFRNGFQIEQRNTTASSTVTVVSLDDRPLDVSREFLLAATAQVANLGAVFAPGTRGLETWGSGPIQMEGVDLYVILPAVLGDSALAQPLGPDGQPYGTAIPSRKLADGRLALALATATAGSPWFRLRIVDPTTSVAEAPMASTVVAPNPASSSVLVRHAGLRSVDLVDAVGRVVASFVGDDGHCRLDVTNLPNGVYRLLLHREGGWDVRQIVVAR